MWGFQLWVNLPARDKMIAPRYQDIAPERVPEAALARRRQGARARRRVRGRHRAGRGHRHRAAAARPGAAGGRARRGAAAARAISVFVYAFEGDAAVGEAGRRRAARLGRGAGRGRLRRSLGGGNAAARVLLAAARPLARAGGALWAVRDEHARPRSARRSRISRPGGSEPQRGFGGRRQARRIGIEPGIAGDALGQGLAEAIDRGQRAVAILHRNGRRRGVGPDRRGLGRVPAVLRRRELGAVLPGIAAGERDHQAAADALGRNDMRG